MKAIRVPGDKVRAVCPHCRRLVPSTWRYEDFRLDSGICVQDVLQAYCDTCGTSVLVAQQSAPLIKDAREADRRRVSVRLPRPLLDYARMVAPGPWPAEKGSPVGMVLQAMLRNGDQPQRRKSLVRIIRGVEGDPVLKQPSDVAVYFRLESAHVSTMEHLRRATHLRSISQVIKRMLVAAEQDQTTHQVLQAMATAG